MLFARARRRRLIIRLLPDPSAPAPCPGRPRRATIGAWARLTPDLQIGAYAAGIAEGKGIHVLGSRFVLTTRPAPVRGA